jgi:hypothetical protein
MCICIFGLSLDAVLGMVVVDEVVGSDSVLDKMMVTMPLNANTNNAFVLWQVFAD